MTSAVVPITIITSTLNCAKSLAATAESIRAQSHPALHWIVADGASSDGTVEVIRSNADIVVHWFLAPDTGIGGVTPMSILKTSANEFLTVHDKATPPTLV